MLKCRGENEARTYEMGGQPRHLRPPGRGRGARSWCWAATPEPFGPLAFAERVADSHPGRHRTAASTGIGHFGPLRGPGRWSRTSSPTSSPARLRRLRPGAPPRIANSRAPLSYDRAMAYPVPTSLSPSRVEAFTSCPLAFRFASIDHLPEPPDRPRHQGLARPPRRSSCSSAASPPTARPAAARRPGRGRRRAAGRPRARQLGLDEPRPRPPSSPRPSALVERYFTMEDPRTVRAIGLELQLEAQVGELHAAGHHRPARARRRRRARRHRLQDRPPAHGQPRAATPRRRPLLRLPVRAGRSGGARPASSSCTSAPARSSRPARPSSRSGSCPAAPRPCTRPSRGPAPRRTSGPAPGRSATSAPSSRGARPSAATPSRAAVEAPARLRPAGPAARFRSRPDGALPSGTTRRSSSGPPSRRFDAAVDRAFDRLRGNPVADRVFLTASALGDWSLLLAPARRRPGRSPTRAGCPTCSGCRPPSASSRCS